MERSIADNFADISRALPELFEPELNKFDMGLNDILSSFRFLILFPWEFYINLLSIQIDVYYILIHVFCEALLINCSQMRAARAMLGIDQRKLAEMAGVSLPTIQRMENSKGPVRGNIDTLTKIVSALDNAGIELIAENAYSISTGRGVRFKKPDV